MKPAPTSLLRRTEAHGAERMGHFMTRRAARTLCGVHLVEPVEARSVQCPRCLAVVMPGRSPAT